MLRWDARPGQNVIWSYIQGYAREPGQNVIQCVTTEGTTTKYNPMVHEGQGKMLFDVTPAGTWTKYTLVVGGCLGNMLFNVISKHWGFDKMVSMYHLMARGAVKMFDVTLAGIRTNYNSMACGTWEKCYWMLRRNQGSKKWYLMLHLIARKGLGNMLFDVTLAGARTEFSIACGALEKCYLNYAGSYPDKI